MSDCDRCRKLETALRALYEFMQRDRRAKSEDVDRVIGLVHDVLPEMVEKEQSEQRKNYIYGDW